MTEVTALSGEKKNAQRKRKSFTRSPRPLNVLLTLDENGKPQIAVASYNAQDILTVFATEMKAGKDPVLTTWIPPAKAKNEGGGNAA